MASISNFKGKKAAPFAKGGKRRKAVMIRDRAKTRKGGADLAFRYRHGWIKVGSEAPKKGTFVHGPKSANSSNAGSGTYKNTREGALRSAKLAAKNARKRKKKEGGPLGAQSEWDRLAANVRAQREKSLATPATGTEIDLDWSKWNAERKQGMHRAAKARTAAATSTGAVSAQDIRGFKKTAGLKKGGNMLGEHAQRALERRASAKGTNFRAKAILAAERGDTKAAQRFMAKRAAHKAAQIVQKRTGRKVSI